MRFHPAPALLAASVAAAVGLSACAAPQTTPAAPPAAATTAAATTAAAEVNPAGDIPDNQVFVNATGPSGKYRLQVPEGWAETATATFVAYTDKLNSITVVESRAPAAPTVKSVKADKVPQLQKIVPHMALASVSAFALPGGTGVLIRYQGDSAADPVTNKVRRQAVERYLFWNNGTLATLTLAGPAEADNVDPWAKVSGSFQWLK